ncbi:ECF transporter S component [Metabacillus sediminilitoris]|uniref:ECF transporter S component n=1 Tax=Metabacillus sediminilitoris TaxID=2567941 RepID=A0A4S4C047_9BACI|nr:ECF transporter S component [Metabacillus sediminilitoris]QGQ47960.1 ECF transporter S component [Metabacillus sediminilitoris]THF80926.1 ECF transporter S component [Metabacillus sediminilitoris]
MARSRVILLVIAAFISLILIVEPLISSQQYVLVSFLIISCTFLPFMIRFERRKVAGRELVMLAVLAAIAAVSRVPFASIPSVQPTTFVIIVTGIAFGAESGFVVGALAALVSNLFLGQGPWTPWQMYAWGMIGLTAGLLRHTWLMKHTIGRLIFGFMAGILFGWVMNLWYFVSLGERVGMAEIVAYYGASLYFDLAHAFSNVFFLIVFANSWVKILQRFRKKYGLLDQ